MREFHNEVGTSASSLLTAVELSIVVSIQVCGRNELIEGIHVAVDDFEDNAEVGHLFV